jgi:predicted metal-binding membrane protein
VYRSTAPAATSAATALQTVPVPTSDAAGDAEEPYFERTVSAELPSGWIEVGVGVLVLPLTVVIVAMMAPMIWWFAPNTRR